MAANAAAHTAGADQQDPHALLPPLGPRGSVSVAPAGRPVRVRGRRRRRARGCARDCAPTHPGPRPRGPRPGVMSANHQAWVSTTVPSSVRTTRAAHSWACPGVSITETSSLRWWPSPSWASQSDPSYTESTSTTSAVGNIPTLRVWSRWWWVTKTWVTSSTVRPCPPRASVSSAGIGQDPGVDDDHQVTVADQADRRVDGARRRRSARRGRRSGRRPLPCCSRSSYSPM